MSAGAGATERTGELAGAWITAPTKSAMGSGLFVFEHSEAKWSGYSTTVFGKTQLKNVTVEGSHISFDASLDLGISTPPPPTITVHGIIKGDVLRLSIPSPLGHLKERIARRATAGEMQAYLGSTGQLLLPSLPYNGLAALPPMGWNSWNRFGLKANDGIVREIADALVQTGLRDAGYMYINIDDGWQGERDAQGVLHANKRYPDMKALGAYIHSRGLKFGIYSSPGPQTCGGFAGSYGHEEQDAKMYAEWGVDYLKYDWCSADLMYDTPAEMQAAYLRMGTALRATGRPVVYALCQYGLYDVGQWGRAVGGNSWRTTFDIVDHWSDMERIGFNQDANAANSGPGGWNDPDMLEIGNGGMSLDEYRTHFTLWSMQSAPLLLGNDIRHMTAEIRGLLTNKEVIAIDQDPAGRPAERVYHQDKIEIWSKRLANGDVAVALFNRDTAPAEAHAVWSDMGLMKVDAVRDLWQQSNLEGPLLRTQYQTVLPPHGVALLRLKTETALNVVFIGDSITQGDAPAQASQYLSKEIRLGQVHFSNQGHSGFTTVNFLPSQGETFEAVEHAAAQLERSSQDTLVFSIMLGTNDSAMEGPLGSPVSAESYRKNLESIIDRLLGDYPTSKVVVHRPIWYSPNTYNASRYLTDGLLRLESYFGEIDAAVASYAQRSPGRVFTGDQEAFNFFRDNYQAYLLPEEGQRGTFYLHPNEDGAQALGHFWAAAISRSLHQQFDCDQHCVAHVQP